MALTDSLRILITANGAQAEREFAKVGQSARRNLGQAEQASQRYSRVLTSAGVAMATFGAVALVGLGKAAQAAEEENAALLRLQNSIQNMPELAGASTAAFLDQAAALQDTTKFADDATVSAQAMLGTFHLTEQQILDLIPAVQDYAAKFGVDLVTASKQVGRAVSGSAGALTRNGIAMNEAAFAADSYSETLRALRENAEGYAEQEGKTLSGQLAILKNNMMDVAEAVGGGATSAFSDLIGPVNLASDAIQGLNPETQNLVGRLLTFGAVGLTAAGGLAFVAGQALKLKAALQAVGDTAVATRAKILAVQASTISANAAAGTYAGSNLALAGTYGAVTLAAAGATTAIQGLLIAGLDFWGNLTGWFSASFDWNPFSNANDGVQLLNKQVVELDRGAGTQAMQGLQESAEAAGVAIDELSQEIQDYLNGTFDLPAAQRDLRQSFDDLFGTLLTEGHSVDDVAVSLEGVTEATAGVVAAGGDANAVALLSIQRLREQKDQGLITAEMFRLHRDLILNIPGVSLTEFSQPGMAGAQSEVIRYRGRVYSVPPGWKTTFTADTGTAQGNVQALIDKIRVLNSTVAGMPGGGSGGGLSAKVGALNQGLGEDSAVGRMFPLGGTSIVGERGPELITIPSGGRVFNNAESAMRLRGAGRDNGGDIIVTVPVHLDGEKIAETQAVVNRRYNLARSSG